MATKKQKAEAARRKLQEAGWAGGQSAYGPPKTFEQQPVDETAGGLIGPGLSDYNPLGSGGDSGGSDTSSNDERIAELVRKIQEEGGLSKEAALKAIEDYRSGALSDLSEANTGSNIFQKKAIGELESYLGGMADVNFGDYVGDLESEGAKAFADQQSRDAQYEALDKLKGWTDPTMTAKERFMQEQSRLAQEQDMRASREAVLRDLAARGVRSGASEMAAFHGAQQATAQNRMLGDLGAQANAVERALLATEKYGTQAGEISQQTFDERFKAGSQADVVRMFNNKLATDYQTNKARHDLDQEEMKFGRRETVADKKIGYAEDRSDRALGEANAEGQATTLEVGTNLNNPIIEGLKAALAAEEADKAAKMMKPKERTMSEKLLDPLNLGG